MATLSKKNFQKVFLLSVFETIRDNGFNTNHDQNIVLKISIPKTINNGKLLFPVLALTKVGTKNILNSNK